MILYLLLYIKKRSSHSLSLPLSHTHSLSISISPLPFMPANSESFKDITLWSYTVLDLYGHHVIVWRHLATGINSGSYELTCLSELTNNFDLILVIKCEENQDRSYYLSYQRHLRGSVYRFELNLSVDLTLLFQAYNGI